MDREAVHPLGQWLHQIKQRLPWHNGLHLSQKPFAPGVLLGCGLLVISASDLLATRDARPNQELQGYSPSFRSTASTARSQTISGLEAALSELGRHGGPTPPVSPPKGRQEGFERILSAF
jgi:hypothetical protein